MDEKPIPHLTEVPAQPRDVGFAARIAELRRYKGPKEIRQGLCPSCLDSGYVHTVRHETLGAVYRTVGKDRDGRDVDMLVRCDCPLGRAKTTREHAGHADEDQILYERAALSS